MVVTDNISKIIFVALLHALIGYYINIYRKHKSINI